MAHHDPVAAARRALDERLDRAFEGATPAPITAAIDALIAAVRAEQRETITQLQETLTAALEAWKDETAQRDTR